MLKKKTPAGCQPVGAHRKAQQQAKSRPVGTGRASAKKNFASEHSHLPPISFWRDLDDLTLQQRDVIVRAVEAAYRRGFGQAASQASEALELGEATAASMAAWHRAVDNWRFAARIEKAPETGYWRAPPEHWQFMPVKGVGR